MPPTLLVVSGPPATGKTTLAHALAQALHCPAICRDEIKEGFISGAASESFSPQRGDAANLEATAAFFDVVEPPDPAWRHAGRRSGISTPPLGAAAHRADRGGQHPGHHMRCDGGCRPRSPTTALAKRVLASALPCRFRPGPVAARRAATGRTRAPYQPIRMKLPVLVVDTSDGYRPAFDEIVAFAAE